MLRFKQFIILEAKIDDYKAQETDISTKHDPDAEHKSASNIIDHFHKASPGGNVQHTRWMIDRYKKGEMKQEDAPDMKDTLSAFEKYKPILPKKKIEQYKSVSELKTSLHPHVEKNEKVKAINQDKIDKGSTIVHNSPKVTAYHVHTMEAAQELGKKPNGEKLGWCTSHPDSKENMFNHYNEESNGNFHILHMHKEQYPYRRIGGVGVKGQFQDENNEPIENKDFHDLLHRNPELEKIPAVKNSGTYKLHKLKNSNVTKKELDKLSEDNDHEVRIAVASHHNAHKELLDKLLGDKDDRVRLTAARNPVIKKEHEDNLNAARNSSDKEGLTKLMTHHSPEVRAAVGSNPNIKSSHIEHLGQDKDPIVRAAVARSCTYRTCGRKSTFQRFSEDSDLNVRRALAENPNINNPNSHNNNYEFLNKLAHDTHSVVKYAVAKNSPYHLDHFSKDNTHDYLKNAVASNPHATKKHLEKLASDTNPDYVRATVARHPNTPTELKDKLYADPKVQNHLNKFKN